MRRPFDENEEISRRQALALASASTLGFLLSGCGGGGGNSNPTPTPTPSPTPSPIPSDAIVRSEVRVLPTDGSVTIQNLTATSLVLSGSAVPSLVPGSVIVSGAGSGLLRKVVATSSQRDGSVALQTIQGTLEDLFERASINIEHTLQPGKIAELRSTHSAVTLSEVPSRSRFEVGSGAEIKATFANLEIEWPVDSDGPKTKVIIGGEATIKFGISFICDIAFFKIQSIKYEGKIESKLKASMSVSRKMELPIQKIKTGIVVGAPITFPVAGVPVVIIPVGELYLFVKVTLEGKFEISMEMTTTVKTGIEWRPGNNPNIYFEASQVFEPAKSEFYGSAKAEISCLSPEITMKLYGIAGPYALLKVPNIECEMKFTGLIPTKVDFTGDAVFKASCGAKFEVLGAGVDFEVAAVEIRRRFFELSLPFNGNINVGLK